MKKLDLSYTTPAGYQVDKNIYVGKISNANRLVTYSELQNQIKSGELPYTSLRRMGDYLFEITFDSLPPYAPLTPSYGGCTSFVRNGKLYRNLDWNYGNTAEFLVRFKDIEGMSFIDGLNDGELTDIKRLGQLPYHICDGRNGSGLMVSTHVLFNDFDNYDGSGLKNVSITLLPYYILTTMTSLTLSSEVSNLITNMQIPAALKAMGMLIQVIVTNGITTKLFTPTSQGYQYIDITSNPKLANFKWVNRRYVDRSDDDIQLRPTGIERWNMIDSDTTLANLRFTIAYEEPSRLSEFIGERHTDKYATDAQLEEIYDTAHEYYERRTRDNTLWQTVHSVVYGPNGMEALYVQENYNKNYVAATGEGVVDVVVNGSSVVENNVATFTVPTKTSDITNDSGFMANVTITVTPSMVVSQDPLTLQLSVEQDAILRDEANEFICMDATSLGVGATTFIRSKSNITGDYVLVNSGCYYNGSTLLPFNARTNAVVYRSSTRIGVYSVIDLAALEDIPILTSQLTNDSGFITSAQIDGKEDVANKVALSSSATSTQYPNAQSVWNECVNIRAVAEGKCKTYITSIQDSDMPTTEHWDAFANNHKKADGSSFTDMQDLLDYLGQYYEEDLICINNNANHGFASQENTVEFGSAGNWFFILDDNNMKRVYGIDQLSVFKKGDNLLIIETEVPDRWITGDSVDLFFHKLETSKIDLDNYVLKAGDSMSGALNLSNSTAATSPAMTFTNSYGSTTIKLSGYNLQFGSQYQTIETGSIIPFDTGETLGNSSRRWNNIYLDGDLDLGNYCSIDSKLGSYTMRLDAKGGDIYSNANFYPILHDTYSLGSPTYKWKNLYVSGKIYGSATSGAANTNIDMSNGDIYLYSYNGLVKTNSHLRPTSDGGADIGYDNGSTHIRWNHIYCRELVPNKTTFTIGLANQSWIAIDSTYKNNCFYDSVTGWIHIDAAFTCTLTHEVSYQAFWTISDSTIAQKLIAKTKVSDDTSSQFPYIAGLKASYGNLDRGAIEQEFSTRLRISDGVFMIAGYIGVGTTGVRIYGDIYVG